MVIRCDQKLHSRFKFRWAYQKVRYCLSRPNRKSILLFGLNKSGTTAALRLIAKSSASSYFDDFPYFLGGWEDVLAGKKSPDEYFFANKHAFSRDIIRFPIDQRSFELANDFFELSSFIVTVRNPIENIKSILSRLRIPGDRDSIEPEVIASFHPEWRAMFSRRSNYIDSLIDCWVDAYQTERWVSDPNAVLFRYEDFLADKNAYIKRKVEQLGLRAQNTISADVDRQFQPAGSKMPNDIFFGKNLDRIADRTRLVACKFGYAI